MVLFVLPAHIMHITYIVRGMWLSVFYYCLSNEENLIIIHTVIVMIRYHNNSVIIEKAGPD